MPMHVCAHTHMCTCVSVLCVPVRVCLCDVCRGPGLHKDSGSFQPGPETQSKSRQINNK